MNQNKRNSSFNVLFSDTLEYLTFALSIKGKAVNLLGKKEWGRGEEGKEEERRSKTGERGGEGGGRERSSRRMLMTIS